MINDDSYGSVNSADAEVKTKKTQSEPIKNMNDAKLQILKKYESVFGEINLDNIKTAPILMARHILLNKIEQFYDKQFEKLMKTKSMQVLDLPKIVYKVTKKNSNSKLNFFIQSLVNIIYSADKHANYPQIKWFLKFIDAPPKDNKYLFYIYLRQHFKIITYTNFIPSNKVEESYENLSLSYSRAEDVISQAFYSDLLTGRKLLKNMAEKHKNKKKKINYYAFITEACEMPIQTPNTVMMEQLIALYIIKQKEDLQAESQRLIDEAQQNEEFELIQPPTEVEVNQIEPARLVQSEVVQENEDQRKQSVPQQPVTKYVELDIHESLVLRDNIRRDKKDKLIQKMIKGEIKNYMNKLITNFIKKNEIALENIGWSMQVAGKQLYKKMLYICTVLFLNDREKFFKLLRKDITNDEETLDFWNELQDHYDSIKDLNSTNISLAKDFLTRILSNETISKEILFFLNFHFKNDYDIVNYRVEYEIEQVGS